MVKPLTFKGDKKASKKRKRPAPGESTTSPPPTSQALSTTTDEDDSWVTAEAAGDIVGPILLVLPTDPPSALACDMTGKVFALPIENMLENDGLTAEPHDVRQVWIANSVAGTDKFSFKGHHGRYLSCDKFGLLNASREAISPEESFVCVPVAENLGAFAIQTEREKFLAVDPKVEAADKVTRGDAESIDFNSSIKIRMQARFKPKLKVAKETAARERVSRKELEDMVGRKLEEDDVKMLKRARREGNFHERLLDVKVKGKHDKFA